MDGSVVIHFPDLLVRVSHHGDGRPFVEFRLSITQGLRDSVKRSSSQDEHGKDEVIRLVSLILYSMPIPQISHLPSWTIYLDDIRLDFPYAIRYVLGIMYGCIHYRDLVSVQIHVCIFCVFFFFFPARMNNNITWIYYVGDKVYCSRVTRHYSHIQKLFYYSVYRFHFSVFNLSKNKLNPKGPLY